MIGSDKFYNLWQFACERGKDLAELANQYDIFADFIGDLYSSNGIGEKGIDKVPTKVKNQIDNFLERAEILISGHSYWNAAVELDYFIRNNYDDIRYYYRRMEEED